jgi:hypothetical protein
MKYGLFLLFVLCQLLLGSSYSAAIEEENPPHKKIKSRVFKLSALSDLSEKMPCFAIYCATLLKENGYVGFDLQVFDPGQNRALVFSNPDLPYEKIRRLLLARAKTRPLGYKKAFLFLSNIQKGGAQADFFVETNGHRINDMQASFRGEAECRWFKMGVYFSSFHALTGDKRVHEDGWDYYYENILTRERRDSMRCFLQKILKIIKK